MTETATKVTVTIETANGRFDFEGACLYADRAGRVREVVIAVLVPFDDSTSAAIDAAGIKLVTW